MINLFSISEKNLIIPGEFIFSGIEGFDDDEIISTQSIKFTKDGIFRFGIPFFYAFHTLFDEANKIVQLYPMKSEYIETEGISTIAIIFISIGSCIILILLIIFVIYCIKKRRKQRYPIPRGIVNPYINNYLEEDVFL